MSKPVCSKCAGQHHENQDCVLFWRNEYTYMLRQYEKCQGNYAELEAIYKQQKAKEVAVH